MGLGTRITKSAALFRRAAVAGLGHDERDGVASDLGLWLRIASSWDVAFVDDPLAGIRIHAGSISSESGLYEVGETMATLPLAGSSRLAKLRFLDEYPGSARERRRLKRIAQDRARTELKHVVAQETLGRRRPDRTIRSLYRAARVEPSLWRSPWSAVLLASSVAGRALFDTAIHARSRP
jgi:hypothetical protein